MNVQPTSQNNPNFEKLYAPRKLKLLNSTELGRKALLKNSVIRECADKYDVIIRKGRANGNIETARNTFIGAGAGAGLGGIAALALANLDAPIVLELFFCAIYTMIGTAFGAVKEHEAPTYEYFVKGKKDDIETKEYSLNTFADLDNIPSLTKEIEAQQKS